MLAANRPRPAAPPFGILNDDGSCGDEHRALVSDEDLERILDTMLGAIQAVSHGASYLSPDLLKGYLAAESAEPGPAEIRRRLSFSERRVMTLVARGLGSRQIAGHLSIDMETVRSHRRSLMRKLGVHNAASLTRMALTLNLVLEEEEEGGTAGFRPSAPLLAEVRR